MKLTKLQKEIYEWGEVERDAAHEAQFTTPGGLLWRFFKWCERVARENREDAIAERDEINREADG